MTWAWTTNWGSDMTFVRRALVGSLLLVCSLQIAVAQIVPPGGFPPPGGTSPKPRAAVLVAPKGLQPSQAGAQLRLQWTQFILSPTPTRPVNYFIICAYAPATQDCATTTSRWTPAASAIPRVPRTVGSQTVGHDYRFDIPAAEADRLLNRQLQWTVGSCETLAASSCTFAAPFSLWLTAINLRARNTSDQSDSDELIVDAEVENLGTTPSGQFVSELHAWRALLNERQTCLTDIDDPSVVNRNYLALTSVGQEIEIDTLPFLPNGARDLGGRTVVAIYTRPDRAQHFTRSVTYPGVAAGNSDTVLTLVQLVLTRPAAYARVLLVDPTDSVVELDETDNRKGECQTLY
jgi:hypothetical protein